MKKTFDDILWREPDGRPVACKEKLLVLNENLVEISQACQDALEDAVLMGCDEAQVRQVLESLIRDLETPFPKRRRGAAAGA